MDNIYDTLAKLNRVANRPEAKKIVKEDSHGMMKKGLRDLIDKSSKMNKQSTYKPFGKDDPDYETGLPKKKKDDKMFEAPGGQTKHEFIRQLFKTYFGQPDYNEMTGGRSGMRRLKIITGTTRSGYPDNQKQQDTSDFEKQLKAAGLDQVRVKSDPGGKAVTVLYPDDFRMQSLAEDGMHEAAQDGVVEIGPIFGEEGFDPNSTTFKTPYGEVVANYSSNSRAYDDFDADDNQLGDVLNNMDQHPSFDMSDGINHDNVEDYITMCVKKMSSMSEASKTMVKGPDGKMVPDYAVDGKGKHDMKEGGSLKDAARAGVMARLAELAGLPAKEIEEALGDSPQDTASRIMSEVSLDEEDTNEGNEFSGALEDAKKNGKAEFTVDGKKYKVEAIDSDEDAIQEADDDSMPSMKEMQGCVDEGMTEDEICEKYSSCDEGKIKLMASKCGKMNEGGGRDMECGHCDGTGKHGDKDCKKCDGTGEAQDDDDPMNNESKVEETTSAGAVADGAGSGSSPYKNASVYESNEIVKRARQLNEDMSFTVTGGPDQEPTLNINASGQEAQQLAQLLKLSGLAMTAQQPSYGEVEIQVAEDQEFANGDQNEQTADTNTLVNAISGGINGQKKMAYPKVAGGDNPMSGLLGESELVATSANQLLKQYEAYKAK